MIARISGFLATFKVWLIAIAVLVPSAYLKGCSDGMERINAKWAKQAAKVESVAREASEGATAAKETRDVIFRTEQRELQDVIQTPSGEPVGSNVRNVLERLREQQAASNQAAD
jgi:hypothetical protein